MFDDLNKSVEVVTVWLGELHTLAVRFSGFVTCPAALGLMVAQALWFFLLMLGLTVSGVDD